ncbi:CsbD family protein [Clavibacter michiganensis]|uniref:CsbD family protein n=1 Tax=Clavibacter michiganensis TaxID=28447 RepID=UPI002930B087|nr:CsbD family protein [Clavibacter michiganensis]
MSLGGKAKGVTQKDVGQVEEAVGKKTDDAELTHQGQKDQVMGEGRLDKEKAKDAFDGK